MDALFNFSRACLFLTFAAFAVGKMVGFKSFRSHVCNTVSAAPGHASLIAGVVIIIELLACGCLLRSSTAAAGFGILAGTLVVFTAYLGRLLARGRAESCGCGGDSDSPVTVWHITRNVTLFCLSMVGLLASFGSHATSFDAQDWMRIPLTLLVAGPAYFLDRLIVFFGRELV
ncbi:MauE/DoxX family redox-associated membrane protein [Streptomyces sp. MS1.AVA.3]|uniref:MauE/DoxX family redox-associated membrane protein n=1 Tax=Streptomyces decoyicus TaxID=249567 RepID=UPI0030BA5F32